VTVEITYAAPHHLNADGPDGTTAIKTLRRTRSGDAWQARQEQPESERQRPAVTLGMPSIGQPAEVLAEAPSCAL
jgi:tRNA-2-methylthio-N6-dimethylallyladenosine synthase